MNLQSDNEVESLDISSWLIAYEVQEEYNNMYHSLYSIPFYYQEGENHAI